MNLKYFFPLACSLMLTSLSLDAVADNQLPDIGTAGVSALSIDQEIIYGNAFMRSARAQLPIIDDPALNEYITDLGLRLVSHANNVRFPFTYFLIRDDEINAAAFLGGKIKIHSGLFLNADNESELAGVLAHETSHVTQRHIARYIEDQTRQAPVTIATLIGSVALAIVNPQAGIAALQTSMGIQVQTAISFTRDNEYEADRIGMALLYESGFDPMGMPNFFQKLAASARYSSKLPEMLLTHPLPETRLAEARNRAANYPKRTPPDDLNFQLAKARIQVRYSNETADGMLTYFDRQMAKLGKLSYLEYGKALALLDLNRAKEAEPIINDLLQRYPNNLFVLDTLSDIDIANQKIDSAIKTLENRLKKMPNNQVVVMNLASAYTSNNQAEKAAKLLDLYLRANPENDLGWRQLTEAYQQTGDMTNLHIAYAESRALRGDYPRAMDELNQARATTDNRLVLARIDARLVQLEEAKRQDQSLKL